MSTAHKFTPEQRLSALAQIVSGLAASGHYSNSDDGLRKVDNGKDWKTDGHQAKFTSELMEDAFSLIREIEHDVNVLTEMDIYES